MASKLAEKLLVELQAQFAKQGLTMHEGDSPWVSFPAAHPDVGDLRIHDDIDELMVEIGKLTHGHFISYDDTVSRDANEAMIVARVVEFLESVFADRIEFFVSGRTGGGWRERGILGPVGNPNERVFVWSGPLPGGGPAAERPQ
jgi:hypothetical protein